MYRFFVEQKAGNYFLLTDEILHHINVVRISHKPFIVVYQKQFYKCLLENQKALILEQLDLDHELKYDITLALPLIEWTRFEWALEKAVELGVARIIPFTSRFTNQKQESFQHKISRFQRIIKAAAQQSFRNYIPVLENLISYQQLFTTNKIIYLAHSDYNDNLQPITSINNDCLLVVGPEGGFDHNEIAFAQMHKTQLVSLGKTILRSETAAIKFLSLIKEGVKNV